VNVLAGARLEQGFLTPDDYRQPEPEALLPLHPRVVPRKKVLNENKLTSPGWTER
jgi:hypothetical protein